MRACVLGGAGFLGRRIVRLLAERGHEVVCMDVAPADFSELGRQVSVVHTDVSRFEDVMSAFAAARPALVFNLSYLLGDNLPRAAMKVNILGMDNCFEAARLCDVQRVVFASSIAVHGGQRFYDYKPIVETDPPTPGRQYAVHKVFNEWQAREYREKHGMSITAVRAANVSGVDKLFGSVDHVRCVVQPALGQAVRLAYRDRMRCCIHVDDAAEAFVRIGEKPEPDHALYCTGGESLSLGQIADMVKQVIPDADIAFDHDRGGEFEKGAGAWLFDNTRIVSEFGMRLMPYEQRVAQMIESSRSARSGSAFTLAGPDAAP